MDRAHPATTSRLLVRGRATVTSTSERVVHGACGGSLTPFGCEDGGLHERRHLGRRHRWGRRCAVHQPPWTSQFRVRYKPAGLQLMSGCAAVSDARLLRRRRLQGPAHHHRAQPAHPPRRHDAPTHETHVVRTRRARASSPSGTRMRGRTYSSTSQLRQGIPTVFTVRTCAQRSSSPTRPATAYGHFHISYIYGYASPHGGAAVRVSH